MRRRRRRHALGQQSSSAGCLGYCGCVAALCRRLLRTLAVNGWCKGIFSGCAGAGLPACSSMHACGDARAPIPPHPQASSPLILLPLPLYAFAFNRCDSTTPASLSPPLDLPECRWPRPPRGLASRWDGWIGGDDGWKRQPAAAAAVPARVACPPRLVPVPVPALTEKNLTPSSWQLIPSGAQDQEKRWLDGFMDWESSHLSRMIGVALTARGRPGRQQSAGPGRHARRWRGTGDA